TKKLGSTKFADLLESKAITIHTTSGFETFVIEVSALKSESKFAFEYLAMLLNDPNITKNSLEKLQNIMVSSLKRKESDFDFVAKNELRKLIFKGTPLENSSLGDIKSVESIKLDDVKKFLNDTITLSNLILVVGGDIELDEFKKSIKPILTSFKTGKTKELDNIVAKNTKEYKETNKETEQAYIYFGSPFNIDPKDSNVYKAKVASFILGSSGFGSRFLEEIRVKRGLAYSAHGSISINKSHSYFTGYLQTKLDNSDEAIALVKSLVSDFVNDGATGEELTSAKMFLLGSEPLRTETLSQRLGRAFTLYYRGLPLNYNELELQAIQDLTLEDLNEFIKSHKEINDLSFAIVTNKGK
ncbi:MAG: pitrilysin family protein, partial [Arcobacteraceae bacterium]|nr:pitrilysin family protein [Arcobacteraceae bacterium]